MSSVPTVGLNSTPIYRIQHRISTKLFAATVDPGDLGFMTWVLETSSTRLLTSADAPMLCYSIV